MANINTDYLITLDIKNATVFNRYDLEFFVTDVNTCNIFVNLVVEDSKDKIINYVEVQDPKNYQIELHIVKPNNDTLFVQGTLLQESDTIYLFDLPINALDYIGLYKCEFRVTYNENNKTRTSNRFKYRVKKSIYNNLDGIVDAPEYPTVLKVLEKLSDINQYEEDRRANELSRLSAEVERETKHNELVADMTDSIEVIDNKAIDMENRTTAMESKLNEAITVQNKEVKSQIKEVKSQIKEKANKSMLPHYMIDLDNFNINNEGMDAINTTDGINNALTFAKNNGYTTVIMPKGEYLISKDSQIKLTGGITLDLNGSILRKEINGYENYEIVKITGNNNSIINGTIYGDRENHDFSDDGIHDKGFAINVSGGSNFSIIENINIYDTTGYGICLSSEWGMINAFTGTLISGKYSKITGLIENDTDYTYFDYKLDVENEEIKKNGMFSLTGNGYANTGITEPLGYYMTFYDENDNYIGYSTLHRFYDDVDIKSFTYLYPSLKFIRFSIKNSDTTTTSNIYIRSSTTANFVDINNCDIARCRTLGIAIIGGKHTNIKNCKIHDIGGTSPGLGVDIEDGYKLNQYINFENCLFYNNRWGDIAVRGAREVIINNCKFQGYKQADSDNISSGVSFLHSTTYVNYVVRNSNFINSGLSGLDVHCYNSNFIHCNKLEGNFTQCNFDSSHFINYYGIKIKNSNLKKCSFLLRWGNFEVEDSFLYACEFGQDQISTGMPVEKYVIKNSTLKNTDLRIKVCKYILIQSNDFDYILNKTMGDPFMGIKTKEESYIEINDNNISMDARGAFVEIIDTYNSIIEINNNNLNSLRTTSNIRDKIKVDSNGKLYMNNNQIMITQLDSAYYCVNISNLSSSFIRNNILEGNYGNALKTTDVTLNIVDGNVIKGTETYNNTPIGNNLNYN